MERMESEIFPLQIEMIGIEGKGPMLKYGRWADLHLEFLEICNRCSHPLDITRWRLCLVQRIGVTDEYLFPSLILQPQAVLRVRSGNGTDSHTDLYMNLDQAVWSNPHACYEIISIRNAANDIVDIRRNPLCKLYPFDGDRDNFFILDERGDPGMVSVNPQLEELYASWISHAAPKDVTGP